MYAFMIFLALNSFINGKVKVDIPTFLFINQSSLKIIESMGFYGHEIKVD